MVCKLCGGFGYTIIGGKRIVCYCLTRRQILSRYSFLKFVDFKTVDLKKALKFSESLNSSKICMKVSFSEPFFYTVLAMYFINNSVLNFRLFNVYELIEIFLNKHPDFKSLFEIQARYLVLMMGWNEFENRRQEDVILQMLDICKVRGVSVMFCVKESVSESNFPNVFRYMRENNFKFVETSIKSKKLYSE